MLVKKLAQITVVGLACFGALHLISIAFAAKDAWAGTPTSLRTTPLSSEQQPLVSALARLLDEDGVQRPVRWATAIVKSSPTTDLGYLALVTAQIRRESRFLAPDLEWLYQRVVPDLVHSLGVEDPIRTIGPMQVQRWRLHDHFEQVLGTELNQRNVRELSLGIETGVAACVAVLDDIVLEYVPDRRLFGWTFEPGPDGLRTEAQVLATDFAAPTAAVREEALRQKLLSDLTGQPLALDGKRGPKTTAVLERHPEWRELDDLQAAWQERFAQAPPPAIPPRITHDPRLALVLADFHSGNGSSRLTALQALANHLLTASMRCDGKWGPITKAHLEQLVVVLVADPDKRADFKALLASGNKRRWLQRRLLTLARQRYLEQTGKHAPDALVPNLWFDSTTQRIKGLGKISVAGYVAGSASFYEDYLHRLRLYTGTEPERR